MSPLQFVEALEAIGISARYLGPVASVASDGSAVTIWTKGHRGEPRHRIEQPTTRLLFRPAVRRA